MRRADTNILLDAVSTVPAEGDKARKAQALLASRETAISVPVLQEFYVQATRPSRADPLTHEEAAGFIWAGRRFFTQELTLAVFDEALVTRDRDHLSYWDAAIIAAARACGCTEVLSEALNDGQMYGTVRVVNPCK